MQITKQLAIFLDNRPGTLARVADAMTEAKINIYAVATSDTVDHTVVRLIVSDYRKALHVFEERGTLVVEDDVLMIEGDNKPGSLARLAHKLADFSSGVRVQFKAPLDPIARVAACHRPETEIREAGLRHLLGNITRQVGAVKSWQCARCFHIQNSQGCGKY